MATQKLKYTGIGTSQSLNSWIEHLANLLRNLPETLPLNPDQSCYYFAADSADIEELGLYGAFSRNLVICFETFKSADGEIKLLERGDRIDALVPFIKRVVREDPDSRDMVETAWVERLIRAAKTAGAVIPERNARKRTTSEHSAKKAIWTTPATRSHAQTVSQVLDSQPIILSSDSESASDHDSDESSENSSASDSDLNLANKPRMHRKLTLSISK